MLTNAPFLSLILLLLASLSGCRVSSGLPVYGTVESFALVAEDGKRFTQDDLADRVWVADFIFTTCNGPCPRMSTHMHKLQEMTRDVPDVQLLSFTIDPDRDTPEVMRAYAKRYKADPRRWRFLTGEKKELRKVSLDSFRLQDIGVKLEHSSRFVLVDRKNRIRGYYDTTDTNFLNDIASDIRKLRDELL
jgi:protein SCO1/2